MYVCVCVWGRICNGCDVAVLCAECVHHSNITMVAYTATHTHIYVDSLVELKITKNARYQYIVTVLIAQERIL